MSTILDLKGKYFKSRKRWCDEYIGVIDVRLNSEDECSMFVDIDCVRILDMEDSCHMELCLYATDYLKKDNGKDLKSMFRYIHDGRMVKEVSEDEMKKVFFRCSGNFYGMLFEGENPFDQDLQLSSRALHF